MANHMAEVAKMLGVELGEEFTTDISGIPLYFAEDAIYGLHDGIKQDGILRALLSGSQKVIKYRSTPSRGEAFWYIAKNGKAYCELWEGTTFNLLLCRAGNCYCTREEAEANRDKWVKFYASDEVLEVQLNENS